jgi:hypothetical protein
MEMHSKSIHCIIKFYGLFGVVALGLEIECLRPQTKRLFEFWGIAQAFGPQYPNHSGLSCLKPQVERSLVKCGI